MRFWILTTSALVVLAAWSKASPRLAASTSTVQQDPSGHMPYTNVLTVLPGRQRHGHVSFGFGSITTLTLADASAIKQQCRSVLRVSPRSSRIFNVKRSGKSLQINVEGTGEIQLPDITGRTLQTKSGRLFTAADVAA